MFASDTIVSRDRRKHAVQDVGANYERTVNVIFWRDAEVIPDQ